LPRVQGCLFLRTKRLLQRETRTSLLYTYPRQGMTRILKPWATQGSLYSLVFGSYPSINLDAHFTPVVLSLLVFTFPQSKNENKIRYFAYPIELLAYPRFRKATLHNLNLFFPKKYYPVSRKPVLQKMNLGFLNHVQHKEEFGFRTLS
jgi:hypothetical protein